MRTAGRRCGWSDTGRCTSMTCARWRTGSTWGWRSRTPARSGCSSARMTSTPETARARWAESLRRAPVLCHLPDAELTGLIDDGQLVPFAAGTELIQAGCSSDSAYLVVEGTVDA